MYLGGEPCKIADLASVVGKKLTRMGYADVRVKLVGDMLRVTGRSQTTLAASVGELPQTMVTHESSTGVKCPESLATR